MPRTARIVIPGALHHITQRGNNGQTLFYDEQDFIVYLKYTERYRQKTAVDLFAYCLMSNHVHLLVEPPTRHSLADMFHGINMKYAQYFQRRTRSTGHVWQNRYFSCVMRDEHIFYGFRYVECNPVRAGLVERAWDYPWSSARKRVGRGYPKIMIEDPTRHLKIPNWQEYLMEQDDEAILEYIRRQTRRNLLAGKEIGTVPTQKIDKRG